MTRLSELLTLLDDPKFVSSQQRAAVLHGGNYFLSACPGSGKTRSVGIRLALAAAANASPRVAVTLYTNVAIAEIRDHVRRLGIPLDHCHFTGTLHEFLLTFVLNPFAKLIGVKQSFGIILEDDWSGWPTLLIRGDNKLRIPIAKFHYLASGDFILRLGDQRIGISEEEIVAECTTEARKLKKTSRKAGMISGSDALFYSLKILEQHPELTKAIAGRFDELVVDEAQDTSDVQLRALEMLHAGGLQSLVLAGDLNQSIYSFQGARPELAKTLANERNLEIVPLTENYRSSQAICDVTCKFIGGATPDAAVGINASDVIPPELLFYASKDPFTAIVAFSNRLKHHGLDQSKSVILTRRSSMADKINKVPAVDISRAIRAYGRLANGLATGTLTRDAFRSAQMMVAEMAFGRTPESEVEWQVIRDATIRIGGRLPSMTGTLSAWVTAARPVVKEGLEGVAANPKHLPQHYMRNAGGFEKHDVATIFVPSEFAPAHTVHSVKGESHESVLLVAEPKRGSSGAQVELWRSFLSGADMTEADLEEMRIIYVALTRAERYCAIALPDDTSAASVKVLEAAGFIRI